MQIFNLVVLNVLYQEGKEGRWWWWWRRRKLGWVGSQMETQLFRGRPDLQMPREAEQVSGSDCVAGLGRKALR